MKQRILTLLALAALAIPVAAQTLPTALAPLPTPDPADLISIYDVDAGTTVKMKKTTFAEFKVALQLFNPASPGPIGGTTPASGTFTAITAPSLATTAGGLTLSPANSVVTIPAAGYFNWSTRGGMDVPADGVIRLIASSATDFDRLQFGGTSASYPAIKRSAAALDIRLADDSAFAGLQSLYQRFGAGTPEASVSAPIGAIYHRTDGGTGASVYRKESGTGNTGWVAISASGGGGLAAADIDTSAELSSILTDESGTGTFVLSSVTNGLNTRLTAVETDVWTVADPNTDSLLRWNDTTNSVDTTPLSAFVTLTGTQTLTLKTLTNPTITGGAVDTATGGDNDTSPASTAFVQSAARGSQTGVHATPSTTNPLSPTWTSIMHSVWYGATGTINLPAASGYTGRSILIYNTGAFTITIDANGSEVIVRDGTAQTGGVSMTLSSGAGNYVALISDGARWISLGYKGTLAVGS